MNKQRANSGVEGLTGVYQISTTDVDHYRALRQRRYFNESAHRLIRWSADSPSSSRPIIPLVRLVEGTEQTNTSDLPKNSLNAAGLEVV
jgi:hypothetical protein